MRSTIGFLYGFHFLVAADSNAIVPLIPTYTSRFDLSVFEAGVLVGAPAVAMLVLSLPVGVLSDRFGPRVVTVAGSALLVVSALGQALATSYAMLVVSWSLFGITSAIIYTAAPAWLAAAAPPARRVRVLGGVATFAGLGLLVGPAFAGVVSQRSGTGAPFFAVALAAAVVTCGLAVQPTARGETAILRGRLGALLRDRDGASALALMFFVGTLGGLVNLLVPLRLHAHGFAPGAIGIAFTASTALFVVASVFVARAGDRVPLLAACGFASLALGALLVLPVVATSAVLVLVFLFVRAPLWSVVSTISNPLCAHGSQRAGVGTGFGLALMNLCWAVGNLAGPFAGGAAAGAVGDRPVFAVAALGGGLVGFAVLRVDARPRTASSTSSLRQTQTEARY
jgi:MFS family permease